MIQALRTLSAIGLAALLAACAQVQTTQSGLVGVNRTLSAVTPQTSGGRSWTFQAWSDGGAATHVIATPAAATTYTATYQ